MVLQFRFGAGGNSCRGRFSVMGRSASEILWPELNWLPLQRTEIISLAAASAPSSVPLSLVHEDDNEMFGLGSRDGSFHDQLWLAPRHSAADILSFLGAGIRNALKHAVIIQWYFQSIFWRIRAVIQGWKCLSSLFREFTMFRRAEMFHNP